MHCRDSKQARREASDVGLSRKSTYKYDSNGKRIAKPARISVPGTRFDGTQVCFSCTHSFATYCRRYPRHFVVNVSKSQKVGVCWGCEFNNTATMQCLPVKSIHPDLFQFYYMLEVTMSCLCKEVTLMPAPTLVGHLET